MITRAVILAITVTTLSLGGCQEVRVPGVYRIDVQQGNVITQEQLAALERGMEKRKVRFILGTPLVADTFNQDRWDYYYSIEKRGEDRMQRIISVFFEGERLVRVGGDVLAALGPIQVEARKEEVIPVPEGYRDRGLFESITPGFMSGKPKRQEPTGDAPAAQTTPGAAESADPAAVALQIDAEDERYLRDLMLGFGRGASLAAARGQVPSPEPAAQDQGTAQGEQESIFSRWARQIGIGEETASPAPPAQ